MKKIWILVVLILVIVALIFFGLKLFKKDSSNLSQSPSDNKSKEAETSTGTKYSFEEISTTKIEAAPMWLFAVPDDKDKVVLSAEENGVIKMGFFDLSNPTKAVSWKTIISSSDIGGKRVADHWHEFKNGFHWISFSISEANTGYIMKVDGDLNRVALVKAAEKEQLTANDLPANAPNNTLDMPTNDMFLIPDDNGVSVGFFLPAKGHRMFQFDSDLNLKTKTDIGGGNYQHGNGSSAIKTSSGFDLLASESISYLQEGSLKLIKFDASWVPQSVTTLFDEKGVSIGMVSGLYLDDGSLVVNARVNREAYSQEEMLKKAPPGSGGLSDDGADIERLHFDASGNLLSTTKIYEGKSGHRPHTSKIGDKLITTWDSGAYLRIDKIIAK